MFSLSPYPIYQVKVRDNDPSLTWEDRPVWDETTGGISLEDLVASTLAYLRKYDSRAQEIRINEKGSLQGHYFIV